MPEEWGNESERPGHIALQGRYSVLPAMSTVTAYLQ